MGINWLINMIQEVDSLKVKKTIDHNDMDTIGKFYNWKNLGRVFH